MAEADRRVGDAASGAMRAGRGKGPPATRDRGDRAAYEARCDHLYRRRAAPDVDGAALWLPPATTTHQLRRAGNDGVRRADRHWGAVRQSRQDGHRLRWRW